MAASNESIITSNKTSRSLGDLIIDQINIFDNVKKLYKNIVNRDNYGILRSTIKVSFNVVILYNLRKMIFPIVLAIAVFTIPKLFLKPKHEKTFVIKTSGDGNVTIYQEPIM
uniref:Wzz domain-containing protein n=1 Tax=Parastrongyloides trichosuri TaxID=131310 RepID=A0A0N5A537_PARTI